MLVYLTISLIISAVMNFYNNASNWWSGEMSDLSYVRTEMLPEQDAPRHREWG